MKGFRVPKTVGMMYLPRNGRFRPRQYDDPCWCPKMAPSPCGIFFLACRLGPIHPGHGEWLPVPRNGIQPPGVCFSGPPVRPGSVCVRNNGARRGASERVRLTSLSSEANG